MELGLLAEGQMPSHEVARRLTGHAGHVDGVGIGKAVVAHEEIVMAVQVAEEGRRAD